MSDDPRVRLFELMRNHAWSYFQLHAQQRLTTFNFYIVFSSVLTAALFASLQKADSGLVPAAIGLLLGIFSFVFARLDQRNKQLIKNGEAALRALESRWAVVWPHEVPNSKVDVFVRDEDLVVKARENDTFWTLRDRHWSFSDCFGMAFWGLGTLGIGCTAVTLLLWLARFWYSRPV